MEVHAMLLHEAVQSLAFVVHTDLQNFSNPAQKIRRLQLSKGISMARSSPSSSF